MKKIILDCDAGHDDAIAIVLAAGNPEIDLLCITTVSGNHNVENTTSNFERGLGMNHFGGTALEQVNYRHKVVIKLNYLKFCDLIADALERLTKQKAA